MYASNEYIYPIHALLEGNVDRPIICQCGFVSTDPNEAIEHVKKEHPKTWEHIKDNLELLAEEKTAAGQS
jgi:hypothetical protein